MNKIKKKTFVFLKSVVAATETSPHKYLIFAGTPYEPTGSIPE